MTDGKSTYDSHLTIPYAQDLKDVGVKVFSVGVTDSIDVNEIQSMSSGDQVLNKDYFLISDFDTLNTYEVIDAMMGSVCSGEPTPKAKTYGKWLVWWS